MSRGFDRVLDFPGINQMEKGRRHLGPDRHTDVDWVTGTGRAWQWIGGDGDCDRLPVDRIVEIVVRAVVDRTGYA